MKFGDLPLRRRRLLFAANYAPKAVLLLPLLLFLTLLDAPNPLVITLWRPCEMVQQNVRKTAPLAASLFYLTLSGLLTNTERALLLEPFFLILQFSSFAFFHLGVAAGFSTEGKVF